MASKFNTPLDDDDDDVNGDAAGGDDMRLCGISSGSGSCSDCGYGGGGVDSGAVVGPRLCVGGCGWVRTSTERDEVFDLLTEYAPPPSTAAAAAAAGMGAGGGGGGGGSRGGRCLPLPAVTEYTLLSLPPASFVANATAAYVDMDVNMNTNTNMKTNMNMNVNGASASVINDDVDAESDTAASARRQRRRQWQQQRLQRELDDSLTHRMYVRVTSDEYRMCSQYVEAE